jgi:hypothetical protein
LNQNISRLEAHANLNNLDCIDYVETWRDAHAWASEHLSHPDVELLGPQPIPYLRVPGWAAIFGLKRLRDHLTGEQDRTGQSKGDKPGNKGLLSHTAAVGTDGEAAGGGPRIRPRRRPLRQPPAIPGSQPQLYRHNA